MWYFSTILYKRVYFGAFKKEKLRNIFVLFIAFSISSQLNAQQVNTKDQQDVQQAVINFFEALSNRDSVSLKKYCAADIKLIEYGSTWNIDTLILKSITLNTTVDFKRTNTLDFLDTKVNGKTAWANYHLHSALTRNGKQSALHWIETIVAIKENENWKITLLHSTLLSRN